MFSYVCLLITIIIFHYHHHLFFYYLGKTQICCPSLLMYLTTLHWQCGTEPESNKTHSSHPIINRGWSALLTLETVVDKTIRAQGQLTCLLWSFWLDHQVLSNRLRFLNVAVRVESRKEKQQVGEPREMNYFPNQSIHQWSNFWLEKEQQLTETINCWT